MAEYIEREKLMEKFCWHCEATACGDDECFYKRVMYSIPAADVQPVKHGRWELGKGGNDFIGYPVYNCSVCGYCNEDLYRFLYCPNCGARMDGET